MVKGPAARERLESLLHFFEAPASPRPLAVFRIGLALILLAHARALSGRLGEFYGPLGIVQASLAEHMVHPALPSLSAALRLLASAGLAESTAIHLLFAAYVLALHGLLLGWRTRFSASAAWLLYLAFKTAGSASSYGAFEFAQIGLFYCAVLPVGASWSLDNPGEGAPSAAAGLSLRVIQIHICIAYFASGLEKASGIQWWNGEAIWRSLMRPSSPFDFSSLARAPWLAMVAAWSTLIVEIGYAFFAWPRRTRAPWVCAMIALHLGIALFLGLWFFSAVMILFNVAAFLVPAREPSRFLREAH